MATTVTDEIGAIEACVMAILSIDEDARQRVLRYLQDRFRKVEPVDRTTAFPFVTGSSLPADCR